MEQSAQLRSSARKRTSCGRSAAGAAEQRARVRKRAVRVMGRIRCVAKSQAGFGRVQRAKGAGELPSPPAPLPKERGDDAVGRGRERLWEAEGVQPLGL